MAKVLPSRLIPASEGRPEPEPTELSSALAERKKAHTARWDRCVGHVAKDSPGYNAYAVCTGRMKRERAFLKSSRDRAARKKRA